MICFMQLRSAYVGGKMGLVQTKSARDQFCSQSDPEQTQQAENGKATGKKFHFLVPGKKITCAALKRKCSLVFFVFCDGEMNVYELLVTQNKILKHVTLGSGHL